MPKRSKILDEGRMSVLRKYIGSEISRAEASRQCGVAPKTIDRWCIRYRTEGIAGFVPQENNRVYDAVAKEAAVKAYLSGEGSLTQICEKYKIRSEKQLHHWIQVYNGHKEFRTQTGGSRMTKARKTTLEERIAIAKECIASGKNYGEIAIKYNVSYQQVYNWANKFAERGEAGLEDRRGQRTSQQTPHTAEEEMKIRIAQLEHELYITKMERDLLKKLDEIERRRG